MIVLFKVQSIVVGFLASFVACITSLILEGKVNPDDILILVSSSVTTASVASLLLGKLMSNKTVLIQKVLITEIRFCLMKGTFVIIIILSAKHFNVNPDNVATPIAASLGDVVTLGILSGIGTVYFIFSKFLIIKLLIICYSIKLYSYF